MVEARDLGRFAVQNSQGQRLFLAGAEVQTWVRDGGNGDKTQAISCGCAAFEPAVAAEPLGSWIPHQWKRKGPLSLERFNKVSSGQLLWRTTPPMPQLCS